MDWKRMMEHASEEHFGFDDSEIFFLRADHIVRDIRKISYKFKEPSRTSTILHKQLFRSVVREKLSTFFMRKARRHEPSLLL